MRQILLALVLVSGARSFRAAWIPSSYDSSSSDALCAQLNKLAAMGFDRVYLDVFNNGNVYFNSSTVAAAGLGAVLGQDRLRWATEICAFRGEVFAWFEYGLMAQYGAPTGAFARHAQQQGWVLGQSGGFTWLKADSGATQFLGSMLADVVRDYPGCRGAQLDDHFGQPKELLSSGSSGMNAAAHAVSNAVRSAVAAGSRNAPFTLSLSPTTLSQALDSFNVDWAAWAGAGLFDEFVPQLYRSSYADFASLLKDTLSGVGPGQVVAAGLRADGSGPPTSWDQLVLMLREVEGGHGLSPSIWYSQAALELYPQQLAAYFKGPSPSPSPSPSAL